MKTPRLLESGRERPEKSVRWEPWSGTTKEVSQE